MNFSDLIGIPYKEHGRDIKTGLDCYGLAIEVMRRYGKKLNDVIYENHNESLYDELAPTLNVKLTDEIKEGNLLLMTLNKELHIGVIINDREFIHATYNQGVRISRLKNAPITHIYEVI